MELKKQNDKKILLIVAVIVCVCAVLLAIFFAGGDSRKLKEQLNLGNKYMQEMDYEQALAAYLAAIEIDPKNVEAYLGAASAYEGLGDFESALDILVRGYDETGEKGLYLVEIGEQTHVQRIMLDMPQFQELTVNTDEENVENLLPAVGNSHFYRVILTGSGEDIPEEMQLKFPNMEILDRREAPVDLWDSAEEDTLEGTYFRILREAMADADGDAAAQIQLAAQLSRKILEGREVVL